MQMPTIPTSKMEATTRAKTRVGITKTIITMISTTTKEHLLLVSNIKDMATGAGPDAMASLKKIPRLSATSP